MEYLRLILELLYFFSGIVIAVFAGIGLRQLKIAKDNARMSAKREAYKIASEQCAFYLKQIIPTLNKLDSLIDENKIEVFNNSKIEILGNQIKISFFDKNALADKKPFDGIEVIAEELLDVLNSLESFSIYFISGVASESIAFSSIGYTFCSSVHKLLPVLIPVSNGKYFRNIIKLFLMWNSRIENERLLLDKSKLEEKLKKIDSKVIKPLGS